MAGRVVEEVPERPLEETGITHHGRVRTGTRVHDRLEGSGSSSLGAHGGAEVDALPRGEACGVQAREGEQVVDQQRQPFLFSEHDRARPSPVRRVAGGQRHLELGHTRRHRAPQLVGCVGHELSLLALRVLEPGQHVVDGHGQVAHFVVGVGHRQTVTEVLGRDGPGLRADRVDRAQGSGRCQPRDAGDDEDHRRHGDPQQRADGVQTVGDRSQRVGDADLEGRAVGERQGLGHGHHVGAQVDRLRRAQRHWPHHEGDRTPCGIEELAGLRVDRRRSVEHQPAGRDLDGERRLHQFDRSVRSRLQGWESVRDQRELGVERARDQLEVLDLGQLGAVGVSVEELGADLLVHDAHCGHPTVDRFEVLAQHALSTGPSVGHEASLDAIHGHDREDHRGSGEDDRDEQRQAGPQGEGAHHRGTAIR